MTGPIEQLYQVYLHHRQVVTDSRKVSEGCLFFALRGESFNGNQFAAGAVEAGAALAVIDDPSCAGKNTFLVKDVLDTLQELARYHRSHWKIPVIGITGTNGKTTTKELMNTVLGSHFRVHATQGNLNNHIGVPLTILSAPADTEIAIIEMGANHPGEIADLCAISHPTHGLITNIGKAHLEGFGGYEGVIRTKNELYQHLRTSSGTAFVNGNNPLLMALSEGIHRILDGDDESFAVSGSAAAGSNYLKVEYFSPGSTVEVPTRLVGTYNLENVLAAICLGQFFSVPEEKIVTAIQEYTPTNNRSQTIRTAHNLVIMDAYNANPSSMQAALRNFASLEAENKMAILGDMRELGEESNAEHEEILQLLEELGVAKFILVGPEFQKTGSRSIMFPDADSAAEWLTMNPVQGFTVLVKGSRGIRLEKVLETL